MLRSSWCHLLSGGFKSHWAFSKRTANLPSVRALRRPWRDVSDQACGLHKRPPLLRAFRCLDGIACSTELLMVTKSNLRSFWFVAVFWGSGPRRHCLRKRHGLLSFLLITPVSALTLGSTLRPPCLCVWCARRVRPRSFTRGAPWPQRRLLGRPFFPTDAGSTVGENPRALCCV